MKNTKKNCAARIFALTIVVCLLAALAVPAYASGINEAITDAKSGVLQIQIWYVDPEMADEVYLGSGTGFLINESTVITCQHVVSGFSDEWYAQRAIDTSAFLGRERTAAEIKENLELRVSVLRDVHIRATIRQSSAEMDYAILSLDEQLYNRTTLPLRSSSDLKQTEAVYALGFPGDLENISDQNYYDANDVTITSGAVNKVDRFSFALSDGSSYNNVDCVEHSAQLAGGNSGGPLLDTNGAVVGINAVMSDANNRNLSVASDQLIATLDALGIQYETLDDSTAETTEATEAETTETTEAVTEAPAETEAVTEASTETEAVTETVTEPEVKEEGNSSMIILLVAGIAIVAVVVVVVVVLSKGKKKEPVPVAASSHAHPPVSHTAAPVNNGGFTAAPVSTPVATTPMDAGETTVLSQDAGETTVLSRNVNGGTLTRKKNGEVIKINAETFVIGRERKSVNYCIADNSSISRNHVKLLVEGGITYLVDMKTANGTFVNGVKAMPNQKIALKNGDKITLADEDLEFKI